MNAILKATGIAALTLSVFAAAGGAQAADCNRQCLIDLANDYIAALAAHKPGDVPIADDAVFSENLETMDPGDGLWETASGGATDFTVLVPDPVSQGVGGIVIMEEDGKPIELAFRLMLDNGEITEIEHLVARDLRESAMKNLQTPRAALSQPVPEPYRESRGRLIHIGAAYYDALDMNNGSLAPFRDDCVRHENGMQTDRNPVPTGNEEGDSAFGYFGALGCEAQLDTQVMAYIDRIGNRSVVLADPVNGLAMGLSHFHHPMDQTDYPVIGVPGQTVRHMEFDPFDLPAAHIFKIWGGKIHEIEAMGYTTDYNSPNGWGDE